MDLMHVNTPSTTKADSFFEQQSYRTAYAQRTRSGRGKSTASDNAGGVYVSLQNQPASATVLSNRKLFRRDCPTSTAFLACSTRIDLNYLNCGSSSLRFEDSDKSGPAGVSYRAGKSVVLEHCFNIQALHSNLAVTTQQKIRNIVSVFVSQVGNPGTHPPQAPDSFPAVASPQFLSSDRPPNSPQCRQFIFQITRICYVDAVAGRNKVFEPDVDTRVRICVEEVRVVWKFTENQEKPCPALLFQSKGFDIASNGSMKADTDNTNVLNVKTASCEPDTITVLGEYYRCKSVGCFESRVTWSLSSTNSPEEIAERFIEAEHGGLSATKVGTSVPRIHQPLLLKPSRLLAVLNAQFTLFPSVFSLSKASVVQSPVCLKHRTQFSLMVMVGPQPKFVSLVSHSGVSQPSPIVGSDASQSLLKL